MWQHTWITFWTWRVIKFNTFPFSYHNKAWLRESTLQSKMALLGAALARATERPIFTGWSKVSDRSWKCKTKQVDDGRWQQRDILKHQSFIQPRWSFTNSLQNIKPLYNIPLLNIQKHPSFLMTSRFQNLHDVDNCVTLRTVILIHMPTVTLLFKIFWDLYRMWMFITNFTLLSAR